MPCAACRCRRCWKFLTEYCISLHRQLVDWIKMQKDSGSNAKLRCNNYTNTFDSATKIKSYQICFFLVWNVSFQLRYRTPYITVIWGTTWKCSVFKVCPNSVSRVSCSPGVLEDTPFSWGQVPLLIQQYVLAKHAIKSAPNTFKNRCTNGSSVTAEEPGVR